MRLAAAVLVGLMGIGVSAGAQSVVAGDWAGTLDAGSVQLHLVLHLKGGSDDALTGTLVSVDQGNASMAVSAVTVKEGKLSFAVDAVHGSYVGKVSKDGSEIRGTWTQGAGLDLDFKRMKAGDVAAGPKRPQNPVRPYPYKEEEVTYTSVQRDVLAGTLTIPAGKGPFPAVLLITGSGPQDRDESLMGHKPFLVLSDYLTRHGIEVLRADDRGIGKSTGDFTKATTADFATDVEAGVALLKKRPEVDQKRVGLIGHSEGGVIAPMVAARDKDVNFIVLMAGTGVPGAAVIAEQTRLLGMAEGASADQAAKNAAMEAKLLAVVVDAKDDEAMKTELTTQLTAAGVPAGEIPATIGSLTSPWYRYFLSYDPAVALRKVTCPVLAIDGSKDMQVPPEQNLVAIKAALTAGGNTHFETVELPGLNHLFQTAKTGAPTEYAGIEETMSPVAMETMSSWILKQ